MTGPAGRARRADAGYLGRTLSPWRQDFTALVGQAGEQVNGIYEADYRDFNRDTYARGRLTFDQTYAGFKRLLLASWRRDEAAAAAAAPGPPGGRLMARRRLTPAALPVAPVARVRPDCPPRALPGISPSPMFRARNIGQAGFRPNHPAGHPVPIRELRGRADRPGRGRGWPGPRPSASWPRR